MVCPLCSADFCRFLTVLCAVVASAACALPPQVVGTAPVDSHAPPDAGQLQFFVDYGSLMLDESRRRASPQAGPPIPSR
jgi:hypothetical protein